LWIGLGLVAGAILATTLPRVLSPRPKKEFRPPVRSTISLPAETRLSAMDTRPSWVFSPDGRKLVFRATRAGDTQLYVRDLARPDAEPIPGTQGGFNPFFSPDGEWLAFFTATSLKKVAFAGGAPAVLASTAPVTMGGTWAADGSIVIAPRAVGGLARLAAGAKALEVLTEPEVSRGEHALVFPQALPGGRELLVVVRAGRDFDDIAASNIAVYSLATGKRRVLVEGSSWARYVETGYLLFAKGTTIFAAPCDSRSWTLTGPALPLLRDVLTSGTDGVPYLAMSDVGLLAYAGGGVVPRTPDLVLWVDRSGREEALPLSGHAFGTPRISPDGRSVALVTHPLDIPRSNVAVYDLARGVLSTLTPEPGRHFCPAWSPDGRRLAYTNYFSGSPRLAWKGSDGAGDPEWLSAGDFAEFPTSFAPDGRTLFYTKGRPGSPEIIDVWTVSLEGKRDHRPWLSGPERELAAFISPDGRFVTYVSNETGRNEVYVRPYSGPGRKIKISSDGGSEPAWARSGREIFYRTADTLMVVPIETQPELSAGAARAVIPDRYARWGREDGSRNYDVSPDGKRFLVIKGVERKDEPITRVHLIANWPAELPPPDAAKQ
jgi:serine/threonine-protein kinase